MFKKIDNYVNEELLTGAIKDAAKEAEEALEEETKWQKILEKAASLCERLSGLPFIGEYIGDIPRLCSMVHDYATGAYREVPLATIIGILATLIYFVSPVDLIPDTIPVIGYLDDITAIQLLLQTIHYDIERYYMWLVRKSQEESAYE